MAFETAIARRVSGGVERGGIRIAGTPRRRLAWRGRAGIVGMAFFVTLVLGPMVASATPDAEFTLGGTARRSWDPTMAPMANFVVSMDTSGVAPGFGFASVPLGVPIDELTGLLSVRYYFDGRSCGGGSPRISLRIDLNGDGVSNGNAFGYIGPSPGFTACGSLEWTFQTLTDTALRWDLTQLGGHFYNTWDDVLNFLDEYPDHSVLRGSLVDDSAWFPAAAGVAYYDDLRIGGALLDGPEDVMFSVAHVHLDVGSDNVIDFDFGTIQTAVNAASDGDTVLVEAGTFPELVQVTKSIRLWGAQAGVDARTRAGPESVVGQVDGAFQILADNVEINGFTILGVVGAAGISSLGAGIWSTGDTSGYLIANNIIRDNTMGIFLNSDGTYPTVVLQNLFVSNNAPGAASGDAIYSDINAQGILLRSNRFEGHESAAMVFAGGFLPESQQTGIVVTTNEFINDAGSLVFFTASDLTVADNRWVNTFGSGVALGPGAHDVTVLRNLFQSGFRGVRVLPMGIFGIPGVVADVTARFNSFVGNAEAGVSVAGGGYTGVLDATCNWWGSLTGPTALTNPIGLGDAVIDPDGVVDFTLWLPAPEAGGCPGPVHLDLFSDGTLDLDYGTIQPAIDDASPGDTVYVDPGTYTEQVVIDTDVRVVSTVSGGATILAPLFASRSTFTIPTSGRVWDAIVEINADGGSIEGFVIDGNEQGGYCPGRAFTGIMMHGAVDMSASNNHVTRIRDTPMSGCQAGIAIALYPDAEGVRASGRIQGNRITDYQKGGIVVNVEGASAAVVDNVVEGIGPTPLIAQNGIQFGFGATGTAAGNEVMGHAYTGGFWTSAGVLVYDSPAAVVTNNQVVNNQIGIDVWYSSDVEVVNNHLAAVEMFDACGGALGPIDLFGIHFQDSSGSIMDNAVFDITFAPGAAGCQSGVGIVLDGTTDAIVVGNNIQRYQKGGIVAGRFGNGFGNDPVTAEIRGNTVVGVGETNVIAQNGIQIGDGAWAVVEDNLVRGHVYTGGGWTATGILVYLAAPGVGIAGNTLQVNQAGVYVVETRGVNVVGNAIEASALGIVVDTSEAFSALENDISNPIVVPNVPEVIAIEVFASEAAILENRVDFTVITPSAVYVGTLYGVSFEHSSGVIRGNEVANIRMDAYLGLQTGIGIIAVGTGDVDIVGNEVTGYQKGGIVAGRVSVPLVGTVNILGNTVVGLGPTPAIAQNGIQVSGPDARGQIRDNYIEGNEYTGCDPRDAARTGCTPWVATGLLLYNVNAELLKHSQNIFRDNQRNMILATTEFLGF